jgi:E3 ubiquitin-protein ligase TRIP12
MATIARTFVPIYVSFVGEEGRGPGPTREFFSLFSREFARFTNGLFRSTTREEFCRDPLGFFPAPIAPKQSLLFYSLGVLCAKAIIAGYVIDLVFNPAFVKLLRNQRVEPEEVDPDLVRGLDRASETDGSCYYPGYEKDELLHFNRSRNGVQKYREFVRDRTCGANYFAPVRAEFVLGFNAVMPFRAFDILTPEEFCAMLSGEASPFTVDAISKHVEFSGFARGSPVIRWFAEAAAGFSPDLQRELLRFITGAPMTPQGGLASLDPKMTVKRKSWDSEGSDLPTAATCSHTLALPAYETQQCLISKLTSAITMGNGSFAFH